MDTDVTSRGAGMITTASSLAELRRILTDDQALPSGRRRDMISAISSLARALGRPADAIRANPVELRAAMAKLTPAMVGLKPGRWRKIQSLVGAALAHVGIVAVSARLRDEPSAEWVTILSALGTGVGRQFDLWRFARYCSQISIGPKAVTDATISRYQEDLTNRSLVSEPKRAARDAARAWNAAMAEHPTWPQRALTVADNRKRFAPEWDAYPASLTREIDAWIARLTDRRLFNGRPGKPMKEVSVASRRRLLRAYLGGLVLAGAEVERLIDLASCVTPVRAQMALQQFWEKAGGQATTYTYQMVQLVLMIARHEAKLPKAEIAQLEKMVPDLKPVGGRITERNIRCLRQLDDPAKRHALLMLPTTLLNRAKRLEPSARTAHEVETAAMIGLLLHIPMRLGNLRGLRLGIHVFHEPRGMIRIVVPGREVKNGSPIDAPLPAEASSLLRTYIDVFRPLLGRTGSDYLFPGADPAEPKSGEGMRSQIQDALARHVGIKFHPHAFRHLAAYLVLEERPDAHGLVQRILGHTSLHATMTFYSELETTAAHKHLDALLERQREAGKTARKPVRKAVVR